MTAATSPCEEFEIAALHRARGGLDAAAAARLEGHLRSCPACRGFAAAAEATESLLRGTTRTASAGRDWERVRTAFRARRRADRAKKLLGLACAVAMAAGVGWSLGPVAGTIVVALYAAVMAWCYVRIVLPEERRARDAAANDAEMLAVYRADLDKELAGLRGSRQVVVVIVGLQAFNLLFMVVNVAKELLQGRGFPDVEKYVATFVVFCLVGAAMALRGRHVLPRLERERRELGE